MQQYPILQLCFAHLPMRSSKLMFPNVCALEETLMIRFELQGNIQQAVSCQQPELLACMQIRSRCAMRPCQPGGILQQRKELGGESKVSQVIDTELELETILQGIMHEVFKLYLPQ